MTQSLSERTALLPSRSQGPAKRTTNGAQPAFGVFLQSNPVEGVSPTESPGAVGRLVTWAGWLTDEADPAIGHFPRDFRAWSPEGWERLRAGLDQRLDALAGVGGGGAICLRPAAGCIVGDPQACLTFLREKRRPGIELLLDLPSMLTPEMLGELEDHAGRAFAALGEQDAVVGSVLAAPVVDRTTERVRLEPLSDHPSVAEVMLGAWRNSPVAERWVLLVDPRDAALLA